MSKTAQVQTVTVRDVEIPDGYRLKEKQTRRPVTGELILYGGRALRVNMFNQSSFTGQEVILVTEWIPPKSAPKGTIFCKGDSGDLFFYSSAREDYLYLADLFYKDCNPIDEFDQDWTFEV